MFTDFVSQMNDGIKYEPINTCTSLCLLSPCVYQNPSLSVQMPLFEEHKIKCPYKIDESHSIDSSLNVCWLCTTYIVLNHFFFLSSPNNPELFQCQYEKRETMVYISWLTRPFLRSLTLISDSPPNKTS